MTSRAPSKVSRRSHLQEKIDSLESENHVLDTELKASRSATDRAYEEGYADGMKVTSDRSATMMAAAKLVCWRCKRDPLWGANLHKHGAFCLASNIWNDLTRMTKDDKTRHTSS